MELQNIISQIDSLKQELSAYEPFPADIEQKVMQKFRLDWNYNSNNLEGNTLSYGETKNLILNDKTAPGKPLKDHIEIKGHNEAINEVLEIVKKNQPLTEAVIRNLHQLILKEPHFIDAMTSDGKPTKKLVKPGQYKLQPNHVETKTGEIFRYAEPIDTPALMQDLMKWYNENLNNPKLHPVILASEFHYDFIKIHPFDDGNGRLVRLLMNLILMQKDYPPVIIKTKDKDNYINALQLADSGKVELFKEYIGNNLIDSLKIMLKGAKGEDIEEDEDLNKELKLLELKFKNSKVEERVITKSIESVKAVYERDFKNIINDLVLKLNSLKKYFSSIIYKIQVDREGLGMLGHKVDANDLFSFSNSIVASMNIYSIVFEADLFGFKKKTKSYSDDNLKLQVIFSDGGYSIYLDKTISKKYHEELTNEERQYIVGHLIKRLISNIEKHI